MSRPAPHARRRPLGARLGGVLLTVGLLALAACGGDTATASGTPATPVAGFPVTVENCGRSVTLEGPPRRTVPMDQNATEILLALGLEDAVAGYARVHFDPTEPVLPRYADAYDDLDLIAETNPSREIFLAAEPDLALAAFGFSEDSGLSEEGLRADGIETYLLRDQCQDRGGPVELEDLYSTIDDIGALFGVPERADALVADLQATVAEVHEQVADEDPVRVFVYDSGADAPFTVGNSGMSDAIITAAGGRNIFADTEDQFFTSSWEEVLGRDPEVVVIMDYLHGDDGDDLSTKHRIVEDRLATTAAGRDGRIETMQLTGFFLSVRNADSVATLADVLHR